MTEPRSQSSTEKELPFLVFNLHHLPSEAVAKDFERTVSDWWAENIEGSTRSILSPK